MSKQEAPQITMARLDTKTEASISSVGITLAPPSENEPEVIQKLRAKGYELEKVPKGTLNESRNPI